MIIYNGGNEIVLFVSLERKYGKYKMAEKFKGIDTLWLYTHRKKETMAWKKNEIILL